MQVYDSSISTEVSLSRILDEMIFDGTDISVILAFLMQNESKIAEIYGNSILVYELYDVLTYPSNGKNWFLIRNIVHLSDVDFFFAAQTIMMYAEEFYSDETLKDFLVAEYNKRMKGKGYRRAGWTGCSRDVALVDGDVSLGESLEKLSTDIRDMSNFVTTSIFLKSTLTVKNFLRCSASTQFTLIKTILDKLLLNTDYDYGYKRYPNETQMLVLTEVLISLLKQLLYFNQIELFNWVVEVIRSNGNINGQRLVIILGKALRLKLPTNIQNEIIKGSEFSEIVFLWNMSSSECDAIDLFLYIYLGSVGLREMMIRDSDLIEFFNLGFEWQNLKLLK